MAISLIRPEVVAGPSSRNLSLASGDRGSPDAESPSGPWPPRGRWAASGRAVVRARTAGSTKRRRTGIRVMVGPVEVPGGKGHRKVHETDHSGRGWGPGAPPVAYPRRRGKLRSTSAHQS